MTAALGYETWSWRVTGITKNAVLAIARNGYKKPSKMLSRDHGRPRSETYSEEFFAKAMPIQEWWDWVWKNDETTLMTNEEHRNPSLRSEIYPLDPTENYFVDTEVAGWHQTKTHEGAMKKNWLSQKGFKSPSLLPHPTPGIRSKAILGASIGDSLRLLEFSDEDVQAPSSIPKITCSDD